MLTRPSFLKLAQNRILLGTQNAKLLRDSSLFLLWVVRMLYVYCLLLTIMSVSTTSQARTESTATKEILRSTLLDYFSPYQDINEGEVSKLEDELLNTTKESRLAYPPFPRTWIERYSSKTIDTTTTAVFDTRSLTYAISSFAGPLAGPLNVITNGLQLGFKYENSIKYSYNRASTLMVMTSWRRHRNPTNPDAPIVPREILENSVIRQDKNLYNYFKVSKEYPLLGMCKYEMSVTIQKSETDTLSLVFGSNVKAENVLDGMSYTVYSNFFQIEDHIPVEDYLHVRCGENFTEAVRFLVESDFNKMITGHFAHYHPKSECRWKPISANTPPKGDPDCFEWFKNQNLPGLDKSATVPRCILGEEGYPVCTIRTSKVGGHCPLYSSNGQLSTKQPPTWDRQLNPMDMTGFFSAKTLHQCDHRLECKLENGKSVAAIPLSRDREERFRQLQNANYITTCQPIVNRGGR